MRKRYIKLASVLLAIIAIGSFVFVRQKFFVRADTLSTGSSQVTNSTDAGKWKKDAEVTAVGKAGARAREVLNWSLAIKDAGFTSSSSALQTTWGRVRDVMGVIYFLIIIVIGFGLIAKQEWAEKTRRVLPALIIAFIAAYFSYFIEVGLIRFTDEQIQDRFYTIHKWGETGTLAEKHLKAQDLLTVSFSYQSFEGYRRAESTYDEAVANHLLLVKVTTFTNYVIAFIIILRIIMLWGLVIFSPFMFPFFVFPLTKKVATVWLREFFRWLLLGPLFALFITSVPYIWSKTNVSVKDTYTGQKAQNSGIPLEVDKTILNSSESATSNNVYQSGTNIILSPPGNTGADLQRDDSISSGNNLSETDTYSRWIVAILMIWGMTILPFLLLRVIMGFSVGIGKSVSSVFNNSQAAQYLNNFRRSTPPPSQPQGPGPTNTIARDRIIEKIPTIAPTKQVYNSTERISTFNEKSVEKLSVPTILSLAGLRQSTPELYNLSTAAEGKADRKISDLATIEQKAGRPETISRTLDLISNPEQIDDKQEQDKFSKVKEAILMKSISGDRSAQAIKNAISNNASQFLVSDIKSGIRETTTERFFDTVNKVATQNFSQPEAVQIQKVFGVAGSSLDGTLGELAKTGDQRATNAASALNRIKSAATLPATEKTVALQKAGLSLTNPRLVDDPTEKQEYTALREVLLQGTNSGISGFKDILNGAEGVTSTSSDNIQLLGDKFKDLGKALSGLSDEMAKDPRYSNKTQDLKEISAEILSGDQSKDEAVKAAKAISGINSPQNIKDPAEQQRFEGIASSLGEAVENKVTGAETVKSILDELSEDIDFDQNGNATISSIPALRRAVEKDADFVKTKEIWANNYENSPIAAGKSRIQWLNDEIRELEANLNAMLSNDPGKKEIALQSMKRILPLALMGNYKPEEISKYLLAKLDSAKEAINRISGKAAGADQELVNVQRQETNSVQAGHLQLTEDQNEKNP